MRSSCRSCCMRAVACRIASRGECIEYGVGRSATAGERQWLKYLGERFARENYAVPNLMTDRCDEQGDSSGFDCKTVSSCRGADRSRSWLSGPDGRYSRACWVDRRSPSPCRCSIVSSMAMARRWRLARRFPPVSGTWFWGCGVNAARWVPDKIGADYDLKLELAPIAPLKNKVTVLSGFNVILGGKPNLDALVRRDGHTHGRGALERRRGHWRR